MATKSELDLREILLTTGLVQPVKVEGKGGRLVALCREVPGQGQAWLKVVETLLRESAGTDMVFHLCRQYVWKDGRMVFGWHVGLEAHSGTELTAWLTWVREQLRDVQPDLSVEPPAAAPAPAQAPQQAQAAPAPPQAEDDDLDAPEQPLTPDLLERRREFRKHTSATPRAAAEVPFGATVPPQELEKPQVRVVHRGQAKDQKNRLVPVVVEEFPLPHTFTSDMNKPNEKDRGAKTI